MRAANTGGVGPEKSPGAYSGAVREFSSRLRVVLLFSVIAGVLLLAHHYPFATGSAPDCWLTNYSILLASCVGAVLRCFDRGVWVSGTVVGSAFPLSITRDCDGLEVLILFVAAVVAFPARWRERAPALAFGAVAIVTLNIIRLCSLYFVGLHWPAGFRFVHVELWQFASLGLLAALFGAWTTALRRYGSRGR